LVKKRKQPDINNKKLPIKVFEFSENYCYNKKKVKELIFNEKEFA